MQIAFPASSSTADDQPLRLLLVRSRPGELPWLAKVIAKAMAPLEIIEVVGFANAIWRLGNERFDSVLLDLEIRDPAAMAYCREQIADVAAVPVLDLREHPLAVAGEIDLAHRHLTEDLFELVLRTRQVIAAAHVIIDIPLLLLGNADQLGVVAGEPDEDAGLSDALEQVPQRAEFALAMQSNGNRCCSLRRCGDGLTSIPSRTNRLDGGAGGGVDLGAGDVRREYRRV